MSASASVSVSPSLLLPGVQQRPSSFSGHSSIPLSPSFSSFNIRTRTGVFALNCCLSQPQVPVVNGRIDEGASARDEARLGLPSKGRMADDTLDLLKHWLCFSYWKTEISLVVCLLAEILLEGDDLPPSIPPPVFFCPNLILLVLSMKDCQLSVRQVNPRQYVAEIPQLSNLEVWFQQPKDIVRKLLSGDLDLGIVGLGTVSEYGQGNEDLIVVHDDLEYGDCRLSLAIPKYGIKKTLYRS